MNNKWITEGDEISVELIDNIIYLSASVREFLNYENKKFIVAGKGVGKTLLLRKKRYQLENKYSSSIFIPSGKPYLDFPNDGFSLFTKNQMNVLGNIRYTKILWETALILSVISYVGKTNKDPAFSKFPKWMLAMLNAGKKENPCRIFVRIITNYAGVKDLIQDIKKYYDELCGFFTEEINCSVFIFIDRLDQALKNNIPRDYWINIQAGLLEAAWDLGRKNTHVKIYCSIRQEAYFNFKSTNKEALSGDVTFINYNKDDLLKIMGKLSYVYEKKNTLSEVFCMSRFKHPKTKMYESIENYIIRHTLNRPRDFVAIVGKVISSHATQPKEFVKAVKHQAKNEIASNIFYENESLLKVLSDEDSRNAFLSIIPHNIMDKETIVKVCAKFNNNKNCLESGRCEGTNTCSHPFSDLYNIGLLGVIHTEDGTVATQSFKDSYKIWNFDNSVPMDSEFFLIHPCLNELISELRPISGDDNKENYTIPFIKIENGINWSEHEVNAFIFFKIIEQYDSTAERKEIIREMNSLSKKNREQQIKEFCREFTNDKKTKKPVCVSEQSRVASTKTPLGITKKIDYILNNK